MAQIEVEEMELTKGTIFWKMSSNEDEMESFLHHENKLKYQIRVLNKDNEEIKVTNDQNFDEIKDLEANIVNLKSKKVIYRTG